MLHSMTAFSRRQRTGVWGALSWEIRSVNHRYLEVSFRLPDALRGLEGALRGRVSKTLSRGKVECALKFEGGAASSTQLKVNEVLWAQLEKTIASVAKENAPSPSTWEMINFPGVLEILPPDPEAVETEVVAALEEALVALLASRESEGERLHQVLMARSEAIRQQVAVVRARLPEVMAKWHQRLDDRLQALALELEPARLNQEVVLLAQKLDVDEEMERLLGHLQEVDNTLGQKGPCGRRLDFLMQELNREANTLGSKSVDQTCTLASVEIKVLIEQMREQIQNIE